MMAGRSLLCLEGGLEGPFLPSVMAALPSQTTSAAHLSITYFHRKPDRPRLQHLVPEMCKWKYSVTGLAADSQPGSFLLLPSGLLTEF